MKAVILAGGRGTRLHPFTRRMPKPLVPLLNKPVMEYSIELLKKHGISDIIVTLQYLGDKIMNYFGDGSRWGVNLTYVLEDVQLGTAGSVKNAEDLLDEPFIVISGDALTDFDLIDGLVFHLQNKSLFTVFMKEVKNPAKFGIIQTDLNGKIKRFLEKPQKDQEFSRVVNTGIYIMDPLVLCLMEKNREYDFSKELFPILMENNMGLYGFKAKGYWKDIGSHEDYRQAQYDMLERKVQVSLQEEDVLPKLWVGSHVRYIRGSTFSAKSGKSKTLVKAGS